MRTLGVKSDKQPACHDAEQGVIRPSDRDKRGARLDKQARMRHRRMRELESQYLRILTRKMKRKARKNYVETGSVRLAQVMLPHRFKVLSEDREAEKFVAAALRSTELRVQRVEIKKESYEFGTYVWIWFSPPLD